MSSKIRLVKNGCLICGGDVRGNRKAKYYCARCNILFSHKDVRHEHVEQKPVAKPNFVGSKESDKFHKFDCMFAKNINSENRVFFLSPSDAKKAGYLACKKCLAG